MGYDHEAVKAFKNELRSYKQLKRDFRYTGEKLIEINQKIFGYGGPNYDGMPRNEYNPMAPNPLTDLFESKRKYDEQAAILNGRIKNIETILNLMEPNYKSIIYDVYVNGTSMALTAAYNNVTERMLKYWIDKEISDALSNYQVLLGSEI